MKLEASNVDVPETLVYHWLKSVWSKKLKALRTTDNDADIVLILLIEFETFPDDRSTTSGVF